MKDQIDRLIALLRGEAIGGLADYERRLVNNASNADVFTDLVFESSAALMFSRHGFKVTIREKPDLQIELDNEVNFQQMPPAQDLGRGIQGAIVMLAWEGSEATSVRKIVKIWSTGGSDRRRKMRVNEIQIQSGSPDTAAPVRGRPP